MTAFLLLIRKYFLFALLLLTPVTWGAPKLDFPPTPEGFKMGMEVELTPDKLANLVSYFDFAKFEEGLRQEHDYVLTGVIESADFSLRRKSPELGSLTKDYLRNNPAAFRSLPEELKAELSAGLNLKSVMLEERKALVGADEKPLQKRSGLILPGGESAPQPQAAVQLERPKLILPAQTQAPKPGEMDAALFHGQGGLQVPNKLEWEKLYARWENLPEKQRNAVIKLDLLGPKEKAWIFHTSLRNPPQYAPLRLRQDLSEKDAELWKKIKWKLDGDAVEFIHKEPVSSPQEFMKDLRAFAARAGIEREIFQPELAELGKYAKGENGQVLYDKETGKALRKAKDWGSFHYHYSWEGKGLSRFADQLNLNLLARRLHAGILSDLHQEGYGFTSSISSRGLMRLISPDHLEVRSHLEALDSELGHQLDLLFRLGPEEAASVLAKETSELIDHNIARKMTGSRLAKVLDRIALSPKRFAELEQELRQGEFSRKLPAAADLSLQHPENPLVQGFLDAMLKDPAQMQQAVAIEQGALLNQIASRSSPVTNAKIFRQVVSLAEKGSDEDTKQALTFLLNHFSDAREELAPRLIPFFRGAAHREFSDETAQLVITAMDLLEEEHRQLAVPVLKSLLQHNKGDWIEDKTGRYLQRLSEKKPETLKLLAPAYLGLPESASAEVMQKAVFARLREGGQFDWERELLLQIFASQGEIHPELARPFAQWLGSHTDAHSITAAYRMSEHTPVLRDYARQLVNESLNLKKSILLSVFQKYTPRDPETLSMLRHHANDAGWLGDLVHATYAHIVSQPSCAQSYSALASH